MSTIDLRTRVSRRKLLQGMSALGVMLSTTRSGSTGATGAFTVKWMVVLLLPSLLSATSLLPLFAIPVASFQ